MERVWREGEKLKEVRKRKNMSERIGWTRKMNNSIEKK